MKSLFVQFPALSISFSSVLGQGKSWAGVNHYYLSDLPPSELNKTLDSLHSAGVQIIRTFIQGQSFHNDCEKNEPIEHHPDVEEPVKTYNSEVMDRLDNVLFQAQSRGIKIMLALHNANRFKLDSCGAYCIAAGQGNLDENNLKLLKTPLAGASNVIYAFDIENEPFIFYPEGAAGLWLCDRSAKVKSILSSANSKSLITTGGLRGDNKGEIKLNISPTVLFCESIDVISIHGYYSADMPNENLWLDVLGTASDSNSTMGQVHAAGKKILVQEWWSQTNSDWLAKQAKGLNAIGVPWLYWSVTGAEISSTCPKDHQTQLQPEEVSFTTADANWTSLVRSMSNAFQSPLHADGALHPAEVKKPDAAPPPAKIEEWQCNGGAKGDGGSGALMRVSFLFKGYCEDRYGQCFLDHLNSKALIVHNWQCWKRDDGWWQVDFSTTWGMQGQANHAITDVTGQWKGCW